MEGISSEAASLAGHLGLDNLCWIFDNNHITIEGSTDITFTEDVAARFLAYGWNVLRVGDANDIDRIEHALRVFRQTASRPTFIVLDSHIGYGSPNKQGSAAAHGEPLGESEARLTKRYYGWPEDASFRVPDGVYEHFAEGIERAAPIRETNGSNASLPTARHTPSSPQKSTRSNSAGYRPAGTATFPCFRLIRRASRDAKPRAKF
jgi:transketolase